MKDSPTAHMRWDSFLAKKLSDIWMQPMKHGYEYIAVYVDDLAIAAKRPKETMDELT